MSEPVSALVLHADRQPIPSVGASAHRVYRWPRLAIEARPLGPLRSDHVRVEMVLVGICGTDLHATRADLASGCVLGSTPLDIGPEGRVLGHEGVGRIRAVGESVGHLAPRDLVTFETIVTCQQCSACRRGFFNECTEGRLIGTQEDGLFRTLVDLPARLAHKVTDLVTSQEDLRAMACVEPAACALVAVSRLDLHPAERVVIFGAGPIGLFAAMLCSGVFGASVVVVEPLPLRRELASPWADSSSTLDEVAAEGGPVDVVIEASGALENVDLVLPRIGPRGRIALLARGGHPLNLRHVDHMITNGISIVGSRGQLGGAIEDVLRLYRAGRLPLQRAVTGVVDGIESLKAELESPEPLERRHSKLLARLAATD